MGLQSFLIMLKLVFVLAVLYTTGSACSPDAGQLLQVEGCGSAAAYCTVAKTGTEFLCLYLLVLLTLNNLIMIFS